MNLLASLLTGTWSRLAGILAAVAGVVAVLFAARKSGADAVTAKVEKENAKVIKRMADAEAAGPRARSDVVDRLRRGGF